MSTRVVSGIKCWFSRNGDWMSTRSGDHVRDKDNWVKCRFGVWPLALVQPKFSYSEIFHLLIDRSVWISVWLGVGSVIALLSCALAWPHQYTALACSMYTLLLYFVEISRLWAYGWFPAYASNLFEVLNFPQWTVRNFNMWIYRYAKNWHIVKRMGMFWFSYLYYIIKILETARLNSDLSGSSAIKSDATLVPCPCRGGQCCQNHIFIFSN